MIFVFVLFAAFAKGMEKEVSSLKRYGGLDNLPDRLGEEPKLTDEGALENACEKLERGVADLLSNVREVKPVFELKSKNAKLQNRILENEKETEKLRGQILEMNEANQRRIELECEREATKEKIMKRMKQKIAEEIADSISKRVKESKHFVLAKWKENMNKSKAAEEELVIVNHIHEYKINQKKAGGKLFQENKTKTSISNGLNPEKTEKDQFRTTRKNAKLYKQNAAAEEIADKMIKNMNESKLSALAKWRAKCRVQRVLAENVLIQHEVRVVQRNHLVGSGVGLAGVFSIGFGVAFGPATWNVLKRLILQPQSKFGDPAMWDWHRAQLPQSMFGNPAMWDSLTQLPQSKFGNFAMWDSLRPQSMFGDPAMWKYWFKPAFSSECTWPLYPLSESAFGVHKILVGTILWLFLLIAFRILGKALGNHI